MIELCCIVLYWKAHCLCSASNKILQSATTFALKESSNTTKCVKTTPFNNVWSNTTPHTLRHNTVANNSVVLCQRASCFVFLREHCCVLMWLKAHFVFEEILLFVLWLRTLCCVGLQGTFLCCFVFYGMLRYVWRWVAVLYFKALCIINAKSLCFSSHWE